MKYRTLQLPASVTELRHLLEEQFANLAVGSPEFGGLLRQLVPEFHVQLMRLCDGGHLLPQARVKLDLGGSIPDVRHAPELNGMKRRSSSLTVAWIRKTLSEHPRVTSGLRQEMKNEERTMKNEQSGVVHSSLFVLHSSFGQPISGPLGGPAEFSRIRPPGTRWSRAKGGPPDLVAQLAR